jgi:hypothetical protein
MLLRRWFSGPQACSTHDILPEVEQQGVKQCGTALHRVGAKQRLTLSSKYRPDLERVFASEAIIFKGPTP